jgi:hypothetical protein
MIQIEIPGKGFLQLPKDASITLKLNNPIFADDNFIPGDYSFPFDISGGDKNGYNAWLLSHPDIPENASGVYEISDVNLYIYHNLYRSGTLVIDKASRSRYKINFRFGFKNIRKDFAAYKIRDLIDETITITSESYYKKVVVDYNSESLASYQIIVNDETYEETTLSALATTLNNVPGITASYSATGDDYGITAPRIRIEPETNPTDITTEFTVKHVTADGSWAWHITTNPFTDFYADYESFLDNQYAAVSPYMFWPFMMHANYFENAGLPIGANKIDASGNYVFPSGSVYTGSIYQPYVSLKHVFDKITDEFGIIFQGDFFSDSYYSKILFYNCAKMADLIPYVSEINYLFYRSSFNVRELVPDMSIEQLLKGLQMKWNLDIIFSKSGDIITVNYRKPIALSTSYINWTGIASPEDELAFSNYVSGYKLITTREPNDSLDSDDSYSVGIPDTELTSSIGSIKQDISDGKRTGPYIRQVAGTSFIPRFLFFVGEVTENSITYHKASYKGLEVNFGGVSGLGETSWKEWIHLIKGRVTVNFLIDLQFRHLNAIDWEKKVIIDGTAYLIKSISTRISTKSIETSKVELYKI